MVPLILYTGYFLLIGPLSLWMLFNAQTWVGSGLAIAGLLSLPFPLLIARSLTQQDNRKIWAAAAILIALGLAGFLAIVVSAAPGGNPGPDSPVRHRFFRGGYFGRYSLTNIIPESEQVNLGFLLMTIVDPYLDREQAARVGPVTMDLYREMEEDKNFHELGSVMGLVYAQLFGLSSGSGHYYLYIPQSTGSDTSSSPEPLPALVFLHGSAGNFKTYTWLWSRLAEQEGIVIIAPTYGFGNWDEEGAEMVIEVLEDAGQVVDINQDQLYLAGLSNGGLGVSRLAAGYPDMFRGLIFISPVFDTGSVDGDPFQEAWTGRPVLIITGEADRRIPISYVRSRVTNMEEVGIDVTTAYYPNEDHFLTFSRPESMTADVADWIEYNR